MYPTRLSYWSGWKTIACAILIIGASKFSAFAQCNCPAPAACAPCQGGLTSLKLEYQGGGVILAISASDGGGSLTVPSLLSTTIVIPSRDGQPFDGDVTVSVLKLELLLNITDEEVFGTSCSDGVYAGEQYGNFKV